MTIWNIRLALQTGQCCWYRNTFLSQPSVRADFKQQPNASRGARLMTQPDICTRSLLWTRESCWKHFPDVLSLKSLSDCTQVTLNLWHVASMTRCQVCSSSAPAQPCTNLGVIRSKQLYNHHRLISNLLPSQMETLCVCGNLVWVHLIICWLFFPQDSAEPGVPLLQYRGLLPIMPWYPRWEELSGGCEVVASFPMWCLCQKQ